MFKVVALLSALVTLALAAPQHHAAQYPAGVNPQDCPNFPICDNARLHNQPQAGGHWGAPAAPAWNHHQQQSSWQQPQQNHWEDTGAYRPDNSGAWQPDAHSSWNGAPAAPAWNHAPAAPAWNHAPAAPAWHGAPAPAAAADKFPAGVNPHSCPNYPFCDVNAGHHGAAAAAAPLPGWTERQYPAGVSPHECPNFPYCH